MTGAATLPVTDSFLKIPAARGRVLGAHLWRPATPGRFPVILEFSPYRVWDVFRVLGESTFPYWAAHGYAVIAIDIAGSGGSTGVLHDEYLQSEIDDVFAVMDWCVAQPWCDGAVGLTGGSWPAFTALRASDFKPPALKAMVLGGVSEDGWQTDIHCLGGVGYIGEVDWAGVMQMFNALPPDPKQYGEGWREAWLARLDANTPWIDTWLRHREHDGFWKDKAAVLDSDVPLLLYAGFADKYAASVLRIAERWKGEVRTIIGPWEHMFPGLASRRPRIDFLKEALRWWDRWLKGDDTGVERDAALRAWVGAPDALGKTEVGQWRALAWPTPHAPLLLTASKGKLVEEAGADESWQKLTSNAVLPVKLSADLYEDVPAPFALDRFEDASAFIAIADTHEDDVEMVGVPSLRCAVKCDGDDGYLIARLVDVAPDGSAVRMTVAARNLSSSGDHGEITMPFQACGWRLKRGHQLGLVLSANGAPTLWPSQATVSVSGVRLTLPMNTSRSSDEIAFQPAPPAATTVAPEKLKWIDRNEEAIVYPRLAKTIAHEAVSAAYHLAATDTDYFSTSRFEIGDDGNRAAKSYRVAFERPGFSIRIDCRVEVALEPDRYRVSWDLCARDSGRIVHDRSETRTIARRP